jgi:ADP-ribose pyrophosphatase YjhB (NUDIX family)
MELHFYQSQILKRLLFNQSLRFSDLRIKDLTSKHFNYHLQELVKLDLIRKNEKGYELTILGKEYVAKVDTDNMHIESQPKVNVGVLVERINKSGEKEYLCTKRLKHPYFGKVGAVSGKVRFGEQLEETARRELFEETGLTGDFQMAKVIRKIAFKYDPEKKEPTNEAVQDQVMFLFFVTNPNGEFKAKIKEQENFWLTYDEILKREDLFNTFVQNINYSRTEKLDNGFELVTVAEGF